jgi:hypothetical protein
VNDQPNDMTSRTRDGKGRFDRDPATVKRDAEAAALRAKSWTYQAIADHLGLSKSAAFEAVQRALADTLAEPAEQVRALELEKLDEAERAVRAVLEREHVTVSQGKVVRRRVGDQLDDDGQPVLDGDGKPVGVYEDVLDDAPVLQAVDRLLKIQERRARLLGLDAAQKLDVSGEVTYQVVGVPEGDL